MKTKVGTYNLLRVRIGFVGGTPTHCQVELNRSSIPRVEFFGGKGRNYVHNKKRGNERRKKILFSQKSEVNQKDHNK